MTSDFCIFLECGSPRKIQPEKGLIMKDILGFTYSPSLFINVKPKHGVARACARFSHYRNATVPAFLLELYNRKNGDSAIKFLLSCYRVQDMQNLSQKN